MRMALFNHLKTYKITMKIKLAFLSTALAISATGCDQKTDLSNQSKTNSQINIHKAQETVEQKKEVRQEAVKALPVLVESSEKKSDIAVKESTEQSLAEISKHSREITKTQESKARSRAQIAEDEMTKELEKFK